jgi:uncharacterized membrane protein
MSAYGITLFLHSWTRWALLIVAVLVIIQAWRGWSGSQAWDATKQKLSASFVHLTSVQLVLGLLLYGVLSDTTLKAMADMGEAMKDPTLRFWAVEHITMMLIAVGLVHVGAGRIKKAQDDKGKHRAAAIFFTVALVIMLASIPWGESVRLFRGL